VATGTGFVADLGLNKIFVSAFAVFYRTRFD